MLLDEVRESLSSNGCQEPVSTIWPLASILEDLVVRFRRFRVLSPYRNCVVCRVRGPPGNDVLVSIVHLGPVSVMLSLGDGHDIDIAAILPAYEMIER